MVFFRILMIIIEVLCAFLLVGVILLQRTKSQGLGGLAFGQSMGESIFGSRAGNFLTKATVILGSIFLANTLFLAMTYANAYSSAQQSKSVMERRSLIPTAPQPVGAMPATMPSVPAGALAPVAMPAAMPNVAPGAPAAAVPAAPTAPAAAPAPAAK